MKVQRDVRTSLNGLESWVVFSRLIQGVWLIFHMCMHYFVSIIFCLSYMSYITHFQVVQQLQKSKTGHFDKTAPLWTWSGSQTCDVYGSWPSCGGIICHVFQKEQVKNRKTHEAWPLAKFSSVLLSHELQRKSSATKLSSDSMACVLSPASSKLKSYGDFWSLKQLWGLLDQRGSKC